jgi:excisionase family DNA binding protein
VTKDRKAKYQVGRKSKLTTDVELADEFGFSVHTLRRDRTHEQRIPFIRIGRSVRYDREDVQAALAAMKKGGPSQ